MIALARQFRGVDETARAIDLATQALALAPGDGEVRALAADLLSDGVPRWHFFIVRDRLRNDAYEAALRRAIVPGCKVLEIGTGTGLLAMMAARAGAHVVTCEVDMAVAAAARDVIAVNGLSDRIRVVNKHSTALVLADLDGPADILVSEIVSNDMLSEGVLPAHEDVIPRLLKPGATIIPARGQIRVALAEDSGSRRSQVDTASGFDLTAFNRLARPYREVPVASEHLALRSAPTDLFDFDFTTGGPWPDRRSTVALGSTGGTVNGIVQWIALEMDDQGRYENRPATGTPSCWGAIFWPFEHPVDTIAGQIINIAARHEKDRVRVWRD
ncbi:50S ribosomal protein L11 methyltransferase [Sphingomonas sp. ERG5]|uniref:50S ribosomal protein L11 methyltransferase n=1 Tax=Sphingomonas sp. ERG5 TaxID=1381597 RepID=UPI00068CA9EF|nr:50S ribosomal protein L11 methyltransferase [Sphingomonas sp. ERG5]